MNADDRPMDAYGHHIPVLFKPSCTPPPPQGPGPAKAALTVSNSAEWISPTNLFNGLTALEGWRGWAGPPGTSREHREARTLHLFSGRKGRLVAP